MLLLLFITFATLAINTNSFKVNRFCVNCKHYINNNGNPEAGKCILFPKIEYNIASSNLQINKYEYLVTGKTFEKDMEYTDCLTAREFENMCGEEGKYYKEKYKTLKDCFINEKLKKLEKYTNDNCKNLLE